MSNQISCPSCNASNPMDGGFCISCGKSLLQKCRFCSAANPISASFCKNCGIELSEAVFGLSHETIDEINNFVYQFPGYGESYLKYKPYLERVQKEADTEKAIINHLDSYEKLRGKEIMNWRIYLHIMNLDWQINKVIIDNKTEIKSGYIELSCIGFNVHDLVNKQYYKLFHERVYSVTRYDKVLRVLYSDSHFMDLHLRVPGVNVASMFLGGFSFLLNLATEDSTSDYQRSVQDRDARERSQAQANLSDWKEGYIQGWLTLPR